MGISLSGVSSGFDWASLIEQLSEAESEQYITPLTTRQTKSEDKLEAWQSMESKLSALQTAIDNLKDADDYEVYTTSLSSNSSILADSLLSATADSDAAAGSYEIVITQLAQSEKYQSASATSKDTDAGWTGSIEIEGAENEITLDGKSLESLRSEINALNTGDDATGVTATILQVDDNDFRLILTHDDTGTTGMNLSDGSTAGFSKLQDGKNAALTVDGVSISRSSNTITDVIPGVTLDLKGANTGTTLTLQVSQDTETITSEIQAFVDAYNQVLDFVEDQMSYDTTTKETGGALFGDNTLKAIKSRLQNTFLDSGLFAAGVTIDDDNRLTLDTEELESVLATDASGTVSLFQDMAQNMNTLLDTYTDSIDGVITLREKSLEDSISDIEEKIDKTQEHIDRRMEMLTNQYIYMESAISEMNSQLSYISSLLGTSSSE